MKIDSSDLNIIIAFLIGFKIEQRSSTSWPPEPCTDEQVQVRPPVEPSDEQVQIRPPEPRTDEQVQVRPPEPH
ncbi:unnamed protein product [Rhizophagus irregularis]|nr:unnamed protein product [Rhizophagus irregularis]